MENLESKVLKESESELLNTRLTMMENQKPTI